MHSIDVSAQHDKLTPIETSVEVDQSNEKGARIVWDDDGETGRSRRAQATGSRRRSLSRDSAMSINSREMSRHTIPIEFRTLSFQVSASKDVQSVDSKSGKKETVTDFGAVDEHTVGIDELYQRHRVTPVQGLSSDAAAKRLQEGKNVLPSAKPQYLKRLLLYVFGGFCSVLWIGVIIFFICWRPLGDPNPQPYNLGLAVLVLIVIFLQAAFSAFQDWSTAKTMNAILDLLPSFTLVLRDGQFVKLATRDLVVGDIVRISIGDKVPADLRLVETSGDVRFDRSAMTGESEEIDGSLDATNDNFLESRNIALMGTLTTNGTALGIVIFTGRKSVMGSIAAATAEAPERPTSIQREVNRFVLIICCLTLCLATLILLAWAGWLRVQHPDYMSVVAMLNNVMGCVVAFIPEGMPIGVALTLMMIARRMKAADVLPKSLGTVEMLGCVQVIASDKTGTLTRNQMSVVSVGQVDKLMTVQEAVEDATLASMFRAAKLCNEASFVPETLHLPAAERKVQGNATDGAILKFSASCASEDLTRVAHVPFNSKNKYMITLHEDGNADDEKPSYLALVKGAPDVLWLRCSHYLSGGGSLPFDDEAKAKLLALKNQLSKNAERVLMLCQRSYRPAAALRTDDLQDELHGIDGLTIIGILGIIDPPRPEAAATVADCRRAGVRFFMMTGDFGLTAAAVARQVGILSGEPDDFAALRSRSGSHSLLLEAGEISALDEQDWDQACLYEEIVFARCSPEQKLTIVKEFKQREITIAVTGDGVNDAPAMKMADVGVAMAGGSDVALEAADLVLLGSFESIVTGIRLGRLVFQNLQKVIGYLLPAGSWSEIWPVLLNVFFGVPLPLSSFLMIIICVFTDLFLSLSLIMETEEFDLLSQPPRSVKKDHLINIRIYIQSYLFIGVMETVIAHSMYFLYYWRYAGIPASALWFAFEAYTDGFYGYTADELAAFDLTGQSVYFVTLVILQIGNILSVRNKRLSILQSDPVFKKRNPWLFLAALISVSIAIFVTEVPGIQDLFGTASVPIEHWFIPVPLALGILSMDEVRKVVVRVWPKGPVAKIAW